MRYSGSVGRVRTSPAIIAFVSAVDYRVKMPLLKCNKVRLNRRKRIQAILVRLRKLAKTRNRYYNLEVKSGVYFSSREQRDIPKGRGWYVILDGTMPLYVGRSGNLNGRLNSPSGSRDNFLNNKRRSDSTRNFIKRFRTMEVIKDLRAFVVTETNLRKCLGGRVLEKVDRENIEKLLDIYRSNIPFVTIKGGHMAFYVYENWHAETHKATVHVGTCGECKNGTGKSGGTDPSRGRWSPPFVSKHAAVSHATKTVKKSRIKPCGHCNP